MTTPAPTSAYDLLERVDRMAVDEYVEYAIGEQHRKRERIIHALSLPIPTEYIRRHQRALYKPLVLAAITERITLAANEQDISPDRVISEHASIAFSNIQDYMEQGGYGEVILKNINTISAEKMRAVKSIETKAGLYGLSTKIVLHDKHPSLKAMGEITGVIAPDNAPVLIEYVKPPESDVIEGDKAPETEYRELLEQQSI